MTKRREEMQEFTEAYLRLYWLHQLLQWENYAEEAGHDLNAVDDQIYQMVAKYRHWVVEAKVCEAAEERICKQIVMETLVDKDPEVAQLRNRLDEGSQYSAGLEVLRQQGDVDEYRRELARQMEPDVRRLMDLRQERAQELGAATYPDLKLMVQGMEASQLTQLLEEYLEEHLPSARELISRYQIRWSYWFDDLGKVSQLEMEAEPHALVQEILELLGLGQMAEEVQIYIRESLSGYVGAMPSPDDVRILIRPVASLKQWLTLYHELGHALARILNQAEGLGQTWTTLDDEVLAVVFEEMAAELLLTGEERRLAREVSLLENCRVAISALYELALWAEPDRAEELYTDYYQRLGFTIDNPEVWVLDSFRSVDPVYIHTYVVGAVVAHKTISYLKGQYGQEFTRWGQWLQENYYSTGRHRSLREKVDLVGGLTS